MAANALWLLLMSCVCDFLTPGIRAPVTIKNHGAMTFSHSLDADKKVRAKKSRSGAGFFGLR
ncbi:hypothetical protein [Pseudomonas sp. 91RF]|jgi:hypothetical protein|uniref:hypothetical protein n=1 Tax=Pseudomonas sp. 91RF TaxID=2292261 RepID=UPI0011C4069B|nr:hypothetical protein [Pseudomonas sp. 91RF]